MQVHWMKREMCDVTTVPHDAQRPKKKVRVLRPVRCSVFTLAAVSRSSLKRFLGPEFQVHIDQDNTWL